MNYYRKTNSHNLMAENFSTQDGHGGRAEEHREEMRKIAKEVFREEREAMMTEIKEMIFVAQYQAYEQALNDVIGVIEYDIQSIARIGIEGCRDIFEGEKAQKFLSDKIVKSISKKLKNKAFRP